MRLDCIAILTSYLSDGPPALGRRVTHCTVVCPSVWIVKLKIGESYKEFQCGVGYWHSQRQAELLMPYNFEF